MGFFFLFLKHFHLSLTTSLLRAKLIWLPTKEKEHPQTFNFPLLNSHPCITGIKGIVSLSFLHTLLLVHLCAAFYKSATEAAFKKLFVMRNIFLVDEERRHLCQRWKCVYVITDPSECSSPEKRWNIRNSSSSWRTGCLTLTKVRTVEDEATGSCQKYFCNRRLAVFFLLVMLSFAHSSLQYIMCPFFPYDGDDDISLIVSLLHYLLPPVIMFTILFIYFA